MEILFEDKHIIVLIKPVGIASQSDNSGKESFADVINTYLAEKGEDGGVYVVHRLDRDVGGIMVYAKTSEAASSLSKQIQSGEMIKEYLAAVHSSPEEGSGFMDDLLFHDSKSNKSFVVKKERKGVRKAKLFYEKVRTENTAYGETSLVKIRLYTGRTHQIRVQFSSRKMPLIGDRKYGGTDDRNIALWSYRLTFFHPCSNEKMIFERYNSFDDIFKNLNIIYGRSNF